MGNSLSNCCPNLFGGDGPRHPSQITVRGIPLKVDAAIGEGGYGFVYRVRDTLSGRASAAKRFIVRDQAALRAARGEIDVHRRVSPHDNIVCYLDHEEIARQVPARAAGARGLQDDDEEAVDAEIWLLMELAEDGSLRADVDSRITAQKGLPLMESSEICRVLSDVVGALEHLHKQAPPVAHWDLKLENILKSGSRYKLCDFGSASRQPIRCLSAQDVHRSSAMLDDVMTAGYRPPESLDLWSRQTVDTKADVWALGVIVYVLLCGAMPFDDNPRSVIAAVPREIPAVVKAQCPELVELVLNGLLVRDPDKRMDIRDVSRRLHKIYPRHSPDTAAVADESTAATRRRAVAGSD